MGADWPLGPGLLEVSSGTLSLLSSIRSKREGVSPRIKLSNRSYRGLYGRSVVK